MARTSAVRLCQSSGPVAFILNNQSDRPPPVIIQMPFQMTRTSAIFCPQLGSACDFLALQGVCKCRNCQPLGGSRHVHSVTPKNQYTAPNLVTVGLIPSDKMLICCEIGKNFTLNCGVLITL